MSNSLLSFFRLTNITEPRVPGYFVASTAPLNVEGNQTNQEEANVTPEAIITEEAQITLQQIAELLYQKVTQASESEAVEMVISVHGFSNSRQVARRRCEQIHEYINTDDSPLIQAKAKNLLYVGYRWSSESLFGENFPRHIFNSFKALPILPRYILAFTLIGIFLPLLPAAQYFIFNHFLFWLAFLSIAFGFFSILTLIVLRLLVYFRDRYRATHFGIPDLVEFLCQLDQRLAAQAKEQFLPTVEPVGQFKELLAEKVKEKIKADIDIRENDEVIKTVCGQIAEVYAKANIVDTINLKEIEANASYSYPISPEQLKNIILTAIDIVTQETDTELAQVRDRTVNILANKANEFWSERKRIKLTFIGHSMGGYVITSAVRTLSDVFDLPSISTLGLTNKVATSSIGGSFKLSRLVLMAPDIPINTLISGRSNFLSSAIRRFEETYLFSNEGDLALRLASTIANYFSFPSLTRESGYRLGNVAIRTNLGSGILNLDAINTSPSEQQILEKLFVDSFDIGFSLQDIRARYDLDTTQSSEQLSKLFSFFDCTNYYDRVIGGDSSPQRVLNIEKWKRELEAFDLPVLRYLRELVHYIRLTIADTLGDKDTHSAYFEGVFLRHVIYRLAFLGLGGLLDSLIPEAQQELAEIQQQIAQCQQEYLNVLRQNTDNNVEELERVKQELAQQQERLHDIRLAALAVLDQECHQKELQVLLSPEQYEVEIAGRDRPQVRREILNAQPIPAAILPE
jgi:hypothetical protein